MLKSDICSKSDAVVDITKFIELLENPDDSDVDQIVRMVKRHKPKKRSEQLNVKTFEDDDKDSKINKEQFPIIATWDCGHQETRYVSMSGKQYDDHNE